MARENPYNRLKRTSAQWIADKVLYRKRKQFWTLDLAKKDYCLTKLPEKIRTANDLGYTVELTLNDEDEVVFTYTKKLPESLPWELQ